MLLVQNLNMWMNQVFFFFFSSTERKREWEEEYEGCWIMQWATDGVDQEQAAVLL